MSVIEPNVGALLWFAVFAGVANIGLYVLSGAFPLETRPDLRRPVGLLLIGANLLLLFGVIGGSIAYGVANLRWTSLVIVGGVTLLFAPGLFNIWPERWRDGPAGLTVVLVGFGVTLALLQAVGAVFTL